MKDMKLLRKMFKVNNTVFPLPRDMRETVNPADLAMARMVVDAQPSLDEMHEADGAAMSSKMRRAVNHVSKYAVIHQMCSAESVKTPSLRYTRAPVILLSVPKQLFRTVFDAVNKVPGMNPLAYDDRFPGKALIGKGWGDAQARHGRLEMPLSIEKFEGQGARVKEAMDFETTVAAVYDASPAVKKWGSVILVVGSPDDVEAMRNSPRKIEEFNVAWALEIVKILQKGWRGAIRDAERAEEERHTNERLAMQRIGKMRRTSLQSNISGGGSSSDSGSDVSGGGGGGNDARAVTQGEREAVRHAVQERERRDHTAMLFDHFFDGKDKKKTKKRKGRHDNDNDDPALATKRKQQRRLSFADSVDLARRSGSARSK